LLLLAASVLTACSGEDRFAWPMPGGGSPTPGPPSSGPGAPQNKLVILPEQIAPMQVGELIKVYATLVDDAGNQFAISSPEQLKWSVSDATILGVSPTMLPGEGAQTVTAIWRGTGDVLVSYGALHASAPITVTFPSSLEIFPQDIWLPPGFGTRVVLNTEHNEVNLTEQATWSVADTTVATLSPSKVLYAGAPGKTKVTATYQDLTFDTDVTVMPIQLAGVQGIDYPPPNQFMSYARVAIDGHGVATAVWCYGTGEVFVSGHDATGWLPATQLTPTGFDSNVEGASVHVNAAGARLVVFVGNAGLHAAFAPAGKSFNAFKTVPTPTLPADLELTDWQAVVTSDGIPMIEWEDGTRGWIDRYDPVAGTWSQPAALPGPTVGRVFNHNGDLLYYSVTETGSIHVAIWSAGTIVSSTDIATSQSYTFSGTSDLAFNDARDAVLMWSDEPTTGHATQRVAQYSTAKGWFNVAAALPPSSVNPATDHSGAVVAMNASGATMIAWYDTQTYYVWINRYTPGGGWEPATVLSSVTGVGTPSVKSLALDDAGNAMCIFADGATWVAQEFEYRRYHAGQGWEPNVRMLDQARVGGSNGTLVAAYNADGAGIMTWQEATLIGRPDGGANTAFYNFLEVAPSTTN
jgi:hypothetical protein